MKLKMLLFATGIMLFSLCMSWSIASVEKESMRKDKAFSFIQKYRVTSPLDLIISTSGGNISIVGWEDNNVEVSFIVASKGEVLDITFDQLKDYAEVEIINENSRLEINVKRTFEKRISIGFVIKTPVRSSTTLKTSGGNIDVSGITGDQTCMTSGGNVSMEGIAGKVVAKTSGGNISINNSSADFNASTSGGNISLENIDGKLDVATSGGNINAEELRNGLSARTSGGNINLAKVQGNTNVSTSGGEIKLDEMSGSVRATTSGGSIKANLISLTEKLELKTTGGSINATIPSGLGLDLDLKASNINPPPPGFVGTVKKELVKGQLNGGGILVQLSTSGGNILLKYR